MNVTGSTYSPASFFAKCRRIRSAALSFNPVVGSVPWFCSQVRMWSMSKIVPVGVQTGVEKGWRETAQMLKGRRLKVLSAARDLERPEPALAEKASSEDHSE